ncbi:MAG: type I glyceraldehyde-3-phosphate dehydrogenase, partial [Candidatus Kerfeldbacteria bacterium]|nr:type I glyceraldehyde-3-phosphate dehydrogenase [Candidatus Kerfeldbacteria bacterium]
MIRIAINGMGRIGSAALKIALRRRDVQVVAVNDPAPTETLAYGLSYDSVYGPLDVSVRATPQGLRIGSKTISTFHALDPEKLPWKKFKVDVVLECTGVFLDRKGAGKHLKAGAKRVVISAPAKGEDVPTKVLSVNSEDLKSTDPIINNASCTTNCIAPPMALLESKFGIEKAFMSTIHGYTADQNLVDGKHRHDPRRGRAAALNIIPTSTGAAIATTEAIPSLKGKFNGLAFRVPVPVGSVSDITAVLKRNVTVKEVNNLFIQASKHHPLFKHVLQVTTDPIVSSDVIGNPASAIVDLSLTQGVGGNLVKVVA